MNQTIYSSVHVSKYIYQQTQQRSQNVRPPVQTAAGTKSFRTADKIDIGGRKISTADAQKVFTERILERIRTVVGDAKEALGQHHTSMDMSAEATASRIFDFATGFFDTYRSNHPELDENEAKKQFVDLVGGAVQQGIHEARDILSAIAPIDDSTNEKIDMIAAILDDRFSQFLENPVPESALGNAVPAWSPMAD